MISFPWISNTLNVILEKLVVFRTVVPIKHFVQLLLNLDCFFHFWGYLWLNFFIIHFLTIYIVLLKFVVSLNRFFKDVISFLHRQPLQSRQKFIHNFIDFVSICCSSQKNLNIILSNQRLWRQINIFHIHSTATKVCSSAWTFLRLKTIKVVFLIQTFLTTNWWFKV